MGRLTSIHPGHVESSHPVGEIPHVAVRSGPFETRGGGALWFFFLTNYFCHFRDQTIFFPPCGSEQDIPLLGHEIFHQFAELFNFFSCVVRT